MVDEPAITQGDSVWWADADQRVPGHLRLRKAVVTHVHDDGFTIECEGHSFKVSARSLFRSVSLGVLEA